MVKTGDEIIFFDAGVDKKGVVVGIEKGEDKIYVFTDKTYNKKKYSL